MNIPVWATHLIKFQIGKGREALVAIKEGGYQYLKNSGGEVERYYDHAWGLKEWKFALKDEHYKCRIEEIPYSLENE